MDGKGCWRDNVFVERLWKTIKYEQVYLHAYDIVSEARAKLANYLDFYNRRRPHTALDGTHAGCRVLQFAAAATGGLTRRATHLKTPKSVQLRGATSVPSTQQI